MASRARTPAHQQAVVGQEHGDARVPQRRGLVHAAPSGTGLASISRRSGPSRQGGVLACLEGASPPRPHLLPLIASAIRPEPTRSRKSPGVYPVTTACPTARAVAERRRPNRGRARRSTGPGEQGEQLLGHRRPADGRSRPRPPRPCRRGRSGRPARRPTGPAGAGSARGPGRPIAAGLSWTIRSARGSRRSSWVATITIRPARPARGAGGAPPRPGCSPEWAVGSSARISGGSWARARAMATRCCWPPDRSPGRWPSRSPSPTRSSSCSARARACRPGIPAAHSGAWTLSRAVRLGTRLKVWNTTPTRCRRYPVRAAPRSPVTSVSPTRIVPDAGRRIAAIADSRVVLPEPLAPSSSASSPDAICKQSWLTGRTT